MPVTKRRTISLDAFVEQNINKFRANALINNVELDFTLMINLFAEYGIRKIEELPNDPLMLEVATKYVQYSELQESGIIDTWKDKQDVKAWLKDQSESTFEEPEVHEPKTSSKDKQRYIS